MVDRDRFMNFVGWVNPYSGRFLSNDNDSAPTADCLGLTRPQILKIGMCMFNCFGFITSAIGLTYGLQECKSAYPEIELPININATQDLINKIDDRNYLRHNCEEDLKKFIFHSAIGFHVCLSIVHLMARTSCLSTLGSLPSRMLNYIREFNERDQEVPDLLPMVGSGGPPFPPRMLNYIREFNAQMERDQQVPALLPIFYSGGPSFPPFPPRQPRGDPRSFIISNIGPRVEFLSGEPQQDGAGSVLNPDADVFRGNPQNGGGGAITGFNSNPQNAGGGAITGFNSNPQNGGGGARASSDPSNPTSSPIATSVEVSLNPSPRVVNV
jgi:hypothetical protein